MAVVVIASRGAKLAKELGNQFILVGAINKNSLRRLPVFTAIDDVHTHGEPPHATMPGLKDFKICRSLGKGSFGSVNKVRVYTDGLSGRPPTFDDNRVVAG